MDRPATWLKTLLRLAVTGMVIAGIGTAFLVLYPRHDGGDLGVKDSQADILWARVAETSDQRFAEALEELGHEAPRVYDMNGNEVYFSTRTSTKTPEQLLAEYQRKFVEKGINDKMRLRTLAEIAGQAPSDVSQADYEEMIEAIAHGEVVPVIRGRKYTAMNAMMVDADPDTEGVQTVADPQQSLTFTRQALERMEKAYAQCGGDPKLVNEATAGPPSEGVKNLTQALARRSACDGSRQTCIDWSEQLSADHRRMRALADAVDAQPELADCPSLARLDELNLRTAGIEMSRQVRGYRSIEAFRNARSGQTTVTASWSDDETFDMRRLLTDQYGFPDDVEPADELPLCESCKRDWVFAGSGMEEPYATHMLWSHASVDQTRSEYVAMMAREGWQLRESEPKLQQVYRAMEFQTGEEQWLRFVRGQEHLTLRLRPNLDKHRTDITAFTSD